MGLSHKYGYIFGGPYNKDYRILGSVLGNPPLLNNRESNRDPNIKAFKGKGISIIQSHQRRPVISRRGYLQLQLGLCVLIYVRRFFIK